MRVTRRLVLAAGAGLVLVLAAIPVVAFAVVPHFVRSTLHEPLPAAVAQPAPAQEAAAAAPALATPAQPQPQGPAILASGGLRHLDPVHFGTGTISIVKAGGPALLRFQDVEINAAPQIYVYLSDRTDGAPGHFHDLGPLKATSGSFSYELPAAVDPSTVSSVVLWCRAFNVTVTYAVLTKPA